jgi:branched-chain amino acid transport system permease protein
VSLPPVRARVEWAAAALLLLVGVALTLAGSGYQAQVVFSTAMFVLLASGWNLIGGVAGHVSFGQVAFFGLGGYAAATAMLRLHAPWQAAAACAAVVAVLLAVPLGLIMLRLRGIFFALGMFGLAQIGAIVAKMAPLTGGAEGESIPSVGDAQVTAIVMLAIAAVGVVAAQWIVSSPLGLRLMAIRDDEVGALASGVNASAVKVTAFAVSACYAAVAGALYVWNIGYIDPNAAFSGTIELQTILMVLIGGIGSVWGPVAGAVVVSVIGQLLWAQYPQQEQIILGALTVLTVVLLPGGLITLGHRFGLFARRPVWGPPPPLSPTNARPASPLQRWWREAPDGAPEWAGPVLSCEGLSKSFGGLRAVDEVDLHVGEGETLAVIGPNGAGKTTLFNLISRFSPPTSGSVVLSGREVTRMPPHRLARAGVARTFQTSRLFSRLTVWETVLLAALSKERSRSRCCEETARVLDRLGLLESWAAVPGALPPGRQRLLEIARAFALRPRVLLLDEAMAGMTAAETERIQSVLRSVAGEGCAVVAIEHVLPAIAGLASRAQVLDFGRTLAEGSPEVVLREPAVVEAYLGTDEDSLSVAE